MRLFAAIKEFGETIDDFEKAIRAWAVENLINTPVNKLNEPLPDGTIKQYYYIEGPPYRVQDQPHLH